MGAAFRLTSMGAAQTLTVASPSGGTTNIFTPTLVDVSVYDIALELYVWLSAVGRPWYGSTTFNVELYPVGARYGIAIYSSGDDMDLTASFMWTLSYGTSSVSGVYKSIPVLGHASTVAPISSILRGWLPWNQSSGSRGRSGSFVAGYPASNLHRPECKWILDVQGATGLALATVDATNPRQAHVASTSDSLTPGIDVKVGWRLVSVGRIKTPARLGELYTAGLEVLG